MRPSDLSLPASFPEWRRHQEEAILAATCSDKRFRIISAPPGIGKSAIYMGIASMLGRTLIQTYTKALQEQLVRDFKSMGLREIKGQGNYPCLFFEPDHRGNRPGCDEGPCHAKMHCHLKVSGCYYYDAVNLAARSPLVVTNYSYRMHIQRYSEPFAIGQFDALILDEAHEAREALADFAKIRLEWQAVKKLLSLEVLHNAEIDVWVEWAREVALPICNPLLEEALEEVKENRDWVDRVRKLADLQRALRDIAGAKKWKRADAPDPPAWIPGSETDWVIEEKKGVTLFQPVWAGGYAERYLYGGVKNVVLTSATITEKDARYLGIGPEEYDFLPYSSPFASKNRPLYVVATAAVGAKMSVGEERIWLRRIDQIIEKELEEGKGRWDRGPNGVIHTVSYARAKRIMETSKYRHLMVTHTRYTLHDVVNRFKTAQGPAILVSPSVATGFDFKGDAARWQILAKIPFIDPRPPLIQARARSDKGYLNHVAMIALIQTAGRIVRSESDYGRSWLVDDNYRWFERANRKSIPPWFKRAIRKVRSIHDVPPPAQATATSIGRSGISGTAPLPGGQRL